MSRSVYLAGPAVFYPEPDPVFARMKEICARHSLLGVSPFDNQAGLEGIPPGRALLERIVRADMELMDRLDGGLFCLDGFRRSPEMDAGTAFEIGYMRALNKPVVGWTQDTRDYPARVKEYFEGIFGAPLVGTPPGVTGGTSGTMRDPDGMLVHSEGCLQNAMIHLGIETGGGRIFAHRDWETAFERAVRFLASRFVE